MGRRTKNPAASIKMSSFEMSSLFAPATSGPQPLMNVPTGPPLWSPHPAQPLLPLPGFPQGFHGLPSLASIHQTTAPPFGSAGPLSTLDLAPKPPDTIKGIGHLTWLSSKAGLITCKDKMTISFQIKDFCDQQLTDLTSVLRVGFTLSFQAALSESNEYIATVVSPLYGAESESVFMNSPEVNLEKQSATTTTANSKDAYSCAEEAKAIPALLGIFQRHSLPQIQLSSMHSHISSCGDEELFRYVGSSSLKRRQFVERRTHLFKLNSDDTIALQPPWIYACVCSLASRLLRRGGATAIQSLYDFYCSADMPADVRAAIGEGRAEFISLISGHPWIFALFPNRTYVSVRRNLPHFDYAAFIKQTFPDNDIFRPSSAHSQYAHQGAPSRVMRSLSHQPLPSGRTPGVSQSRPHSLWETQTPLVPIGGSSATDQWSPLFTNNSAWRPTTGPSGTPLMSSLGQQQQQQRISIATQTTPPALSSLWPSALGEGECTCRCTCGRGPMQAAVPMQQQPPSMPPYTNLLSRGNGIWSNSGGSASPTSRESGSPGSRGPSSPVPPTANMRYLAQSSSSSASLPFSPYDPFGFDITSNLAQHLSF